MYPRADDMWVLLLVLKNQQSEKEASVIKCYNTGTVYSVPMI